MVNFPKLTNSIKLQEPDVHYFVNYCLMGGATIAPLDINLHDSNWPGCCNPSIMWDEQDNEFKLIVRNVNYVLHGALDPIKNQSSWGPVLYSIPERDGRNLKTRNFLGTCKDPATEPWQFQLINTTPYKPIWEFQGEEDARIVRWDGKIYTTGVRRDDNKDGRGRMELMHISEKGAHEVSRVKVKALDENSYCEKNWMPIKDMPFHYVQLANPTVVVRVDPKTGNTTEVVRKKRATGFIDEKFDLLRGSSHVVRWGDHWIAIVHTCELWLTSNERKYSRYCHVFVEWDNDWNIVKMSPLFNFANYGVEFTCGLELHNGKFYIPFAIEDNFVFLMTVDECVIRKFIGNDESVKMADTYPNISLISVTRSPYMQIFAPMDVEGDQQRQLFGTAMYYYDRGFFAAAYCILCRSIEMFNYTYPERFMAARCIADLGLRDNHEISMWIHCIEHDETRPEGYMGIAMFYKCRGRLAEAVYYAQKAMDCYKMNPNRHMLYYSPDALTRLYHDCMFDSPFYENTIKYMDEHKIEHNTNRRIL